MTVERTGEKRILNRSAAQPERDRVRQSLDAQRLGIAGNIRRLLLNVAVRTLRRASHMNRCAGEEAGENQEILDRIDQAVARLPAWLRTLLLGSKDAAELFSALEGKTASDVSGISGAVEQFQRQQTVRTDRIQTGRNAPCPCGACRPDGTPIKYKHCCGKKQ